ncbi:MAG TPA: 1,4-dihydroxy-2-naphthoate polyprenyltransferase [Polyangiaceae bacterium]|jgi:1,4-dihydroxy-2-naphthoate octaprenyltransferase|nr:1,4-dihydroxy-2-naphthoate polyprenyltransferase [Polyangiaceae bacterium]
MTSAVSPGSLRAWVLACRPATLTAAVSPVLVGTACAVSVHAVRVGPALAALVGAMLLQIGSNLANDVFDFEKGADTEERLGPVRAAQSGLLTPRQLRAGMVVVFALALAIGVYLAAVAGLVVVAIGLASIASAIAYTGGPYPLGYHGLGDVFVMAFFGFVAVTGTAFVQAGYVPAVAWAAAVPVGAIATAVLVVNNVRDRETDVKAGKRTLPVRFGRRAGIAEYGFLIAAAYVVPVALAATRMASPFVLLPVLSLPLGVRLVRRVAADSGRALNATLVTTAKLLLLHALLFAIGIAAGAPG